METADVLGSSTAPLTWHDFLERMRQPSAADFVKAIKSFIVSFLNNSPDPERDSAAVQEFFSNMEAAFRSHPLWAGCSEEELESAGEGLEKYVMTKLFTRVFASLPDDVKVDDQLHEKMALIQQFIRPENLDIKPTFQNEASWLLAQKELQKINMYKAPRDKLVCILNCCKVINNLLLNASSEENPPGADDFLPVLIYVTIKANPPQFHSNLLYIQRYRRQTRLVAETAYFFTNILSAESFILNIDAKSLSMDETEFEQNMESAQVVLSGLSGESDNVSSQGHQDAGYPPKTERFDTEHAMNSRKHQRSPVQASFTVGSSDAKSRNNESRAKDQESLNKVPSISDLENQGATLLMKEEKVNQIFQEFPYFYSQSGDLTIGDVEDLLTNYKRLVFKYACLSKGLGVPTRSPPLSMTPAQSQHSSETMEESEFAGALKSTDEIDKGQNNTADDSNEGQSNTADDSNEEVSSSRVEESESKLEDEAVPAQGDEVSKDN